MHTCTLVHRHADTHRHADAHIHTEAHTHTLTKCSEFNNQVKEGWEMEPSAHVFLHTTIWSIFHEWHLLQIIATILYCISLAVMFHLLCSFSRNNIATCTLEAKAGGCWVPTVHTGLHGKILEISQKSKQKQNSKQTKHKNTERKERKKKKRKKFLLSLQFIPGFLNQNTHHPIKI